MGKSRPAPPPCGDSPDAPAGSGAGAPGSGGGTGAPGSGAPAGAGDSGGGVTPCASPVTRNVSRSTSETITGAAAYPDWNNKSFTWDSKYQLVVDPAACTVAVNVRIKVTGTVTEAQKAAWKSAIERKWSNRAVFCCTGCHCPRGMPVTVSVVYVDSGEDYTVEAQTPGATTDGRAGLGGTTGMTGWGVDDTVDVTHEFGHMLGNPEEYFTTNGHDYSNGGAQTGFRDPGGGVMNNPANNPLASNYDPIRSEVESSLGSASCSTRLAS